MSINSKDQCRSHINKVFLVYSHSTVKSLKIKVDQHILTSLVAVLIPVLCAAQGRKSSIPMSVCILHSLLLSPCYSLLCQLESLALILSTLGVVCIFPPSADVSLLSDKQIFRARADYRKLCLDWCLEMTQLSNCILSAHRAAMYHAYLIPVEEIQIRIED